MDRAEIATELQKHRADQQEAARNAEAWNKRARALGKIVAGFEELLEAAGPTPENQSMPWAEPPEPKADEVASQPENVTLNDALERALIVAGPRGATLPALWDFAKHAGAKTSMADTLRATQFGIANLRKKGLKIERFPNGNYVLLGRLANVAEME
jgi:hypothetical protein